MARAVPFSASGAVGPTFPASSPAGLENQGGMVTILGWTIRETGGVAAVSVTLHDGGSATGTIVADIAVPTSGYTSIWLGPQGLRVPIGVNAVKGGTGTLSGVLWFA